MLDIRNVASANESFSLPAMTATPLPVTVLGSINMDIVMQVESLPRPGETTLVSHSAHHPGGKGANQAVAAARMGARVAMLGAVGSDPFGDSMIAVLRAEGIDVSGIARHVDHPTGTAHIAVDARGENLILVAGGANRHVAIRPGGGAAVRVAQLEMPVGAVARFLHGEGTTILNAAPFVAGARPIFAQCDIIVVNEVELAGYADAGDDIPAMARGLLCREGQTIIVTLGAEGAIAVSADGLIKVPAAPAKVVDSTGAGDCFCGVLAASIAAGMPIETAMRRAARAAALAVSKAGAIPSLPFARDVA